MKGKRYLVTADYRRIARNVYQVVLIDYERNIIFVMQGATLDIAMRNTLRLASRYLGVKRSRLDAKADRFTTSNLHPRQSNYSAHIEHTPGVWLLPEVRRGA